MICVSFENWRRRKEGREMSKKAVAGTGYVGLGVALLLSQRNEVKALNIVPEKAATPREGRSPIRDAEIGRFFADKVELDLFY